MENSSYLPNPLTSPALMVLASTAEAARDTSHMQGTHGYSGQNMDKDLPVTFGGGTFPMYRQGDPFPPPLYTNMHIPFVRPNLDRAMGLINPGGGGAFRPVSMNEERDSYQSAFHPAKRQKLDEGQSNSCDSGDKSGGESLEEGGRTETSPVVKEERPASTTASSVELNCEVHSEGGDSLDRVTPDEGRNLRRQRKRCLGDGQTPCCPVCSITLRAGEIESHLALELEKLSKLSRAPRRSSSRDSLLQGTKRSQASPSTSRKGKDTPPLEATSQSRYETYQRVKVNRQSRLSARSKGKKKRNQEETTCPICNEKVIGTPEELNGHVEQCLKKHRGAGTEDEPVDVEGVVEHYEEYTWAGQTRIRATSLLPGGLAGSGFKTATKTAEDEDGDLDVDGDDSAQYGKAQYGEADIIPSVSEEPNEEKARQALRGACLLGDNSSSHTSPVHTSKWCSDTEGLGASMCSPGDDVEGSPSRNDEAKDSWVNGASTEVIESLKAKIREHDHVTKRSDKFKCLICMEPYGKPLTSIQCWHVHCEECWLRTLGAKKLCPQCNMITAPADLRRIYL